MYYSAFVTMPKYTRHTENKVDLILCAEIPNGMAQSLPLWWMVIMELAERKDHMSSQEAESTGWDHAQAFITSIW